MFVTNSKIIASLVIVGYIASINGNMLGSLPLPRYSREYNILVENKIDLKSRFLQFDDHPCKRQCIFDQPMTCYYEFVLHYFEAAGTICLLQNDNYSRGCIRSDGVRTGLMATNRQIAGPYIELCENDTVIVDVINNLREGTTIHWHGLHMRETPHMDGSPYTTQYPIGAGDSFRYKFDAKQHGTFWWHSHMNFQRSFGIAGPLIIRQPEELNPQAYLYDYDLSEHIIFLQDWYYNYTKPSPTNILINGKGHNNKTQNVKRSLKKLINYQRFRVVQGFRYRFRAIYNGNANCPIEISIDNHELQIISTDGHEIEPIMVKTLNILAAERYDFVLYASKGVDNYWMRVKGLGFCQSQLIHQAAIIQYKGAGENGIPKQKLTYDYEVDGLQFNALDTGPNNNPNHLTLVDANSLRYTDWQPNTEFSTHYTSLGIHNNNGFFGFQMDDIYYEMPPLSLLQARFLDIEPFFCNKTSLKQQGKDCKNELCKCWNIIQVPAYEHIEFVISSETAKGHPFHPHGIDFRVVGMGVLNAVDIKRIEEIDRATPFKRRLDKFSAIKDTIQIPGFGYAIIRFYTDNPGYWMFHCHLEVHSDNGMMSILKVGEDHQMVPTPNDNCFDDTDYRRKLK